MTLNKGVLNTRKQVNGYGQGDYPIRLCTLFPKHIIRFILSSPFPFIHRHFHFYNLICSHPLYSQITCVLSSTFVIGFRCASNVSAAFRDSSYRVTMLQSQTPYPLPTVLPEHSTQLSDCNFLTRMLYRNTH